MNSNNKKQQIVFILLITLTAISTAMVLLHLSYFSKSLVQMAAVLSPNIILVSWLLTDILHRKFNTESERKWCIFAVTSLTLLGIIWYYLRYKRRQWNPVESWRQIHQMPNPPHEPLR